MLMMAGLAMLGIVLVLKKRKKYPDRQNIKGGTSIVGAAWNGMVLGFVIAFILWFMVPKEYQKIEERVPAPFSLGMGDTATFLLEQHEHAYIWYMTNKNGSTEEVLAPRDRVLDLANGEPPTVGIYEPVARGAWSLFCVNPRATDRYRYKLCVPASTILRLNKK